MDTIDVLFLGIIYSSICGITTWSVTGLLGGFTMALIIKSLINSISAKDFMKIVIGWFIGIVTGFTLYFVAMPYVWSIDLFNIVFIMIGSFIAGGIGSGIMYSVIDLKVKI